VDVGFGYNAYDPAPDLPETTFKSMGVLVQPGIRLGAEVHFGFMGIAFGTTVQSSPWNIFITNVAAIYYF
jgi:hypothetical protein